MLAVCVDFRLSVWYNVFMSEILNQPGLTPAAPLLPIGSLAYSASIVNIIQALREAKKQFKPIIKDKDNPFFKSKYADLLNVLDATKDALDANDLVVMQSAGGDGETVSVTTLLYHTPSGEWFRDALTIKTDMKATSVGSATTFARRYSYNTILGLASEDDDGLAASDLGKKKVKIKESEPGPVESDLPNQSERKPIYDKLRKYSETVDKNALKAYVLKRAGVKEVTKVTKAQWAEIFSHLDQLEKDGSLKSIE